MKYFLYLLVLSFSINAQSNPCEDKRYLTIKDKSLGDMSDREYEYFLKYDEECRKKSFLNKNTLLKRFEIGISSSLPIIAGKSTNRVFWPRWFGL